MLAPMSTDLGATLGLLPRILFFFVFALMYAAVEIEIEGAHGWAERLPTWYRVRPLYARAFALLVSGKPLTGYHAVMFFIPFFGFHVGFVLGVPWSGTAEAQVVAAYMIWNVVWDFLWFLLNPRYGWARFRKGEIWWHAKRWIGRFPIDYYNAFVVSVAIAALPALFGQGTAVLREHLLLMAGMGLLTAVAAQAAPLYMRWYHHMRRPGSDERALVIKEQR
jgi:hypothetical protein